MLFSLSARDKGNLFSMESLKNSQMMEDLVP